MELIVKYHSLEWERAMNVRERGWHGQVYGWTTWEIRPDGMAVLKWTQF